MVVQGDWEHPSEGSEKSPWLGDQINRRLVIPKRCAVFEHVQQKYQMPSIASEGRVKVEGKTIQIHMSMKGWTEHQEGNCSLGWLAKGMDFWILHYWLFLNQDDFFFQHSLCLTQELIPYNPEAFITQEDR